MLLPVSLLLLALVLALAIQLVRVEARQLRQQKKRVEEALQSQGLTLSGEIHEGFVSGVSFQIAGTLEGSLLTIHNRVEQQLPGPSTKTFKVTLVELETWLPDLVICKVDDIDLVFGPLPQVPRIMTGDDAFDSRYAIFMQGEPVVATGFRDGGSAASRLWGDAEARTELMALEAFWVRVRTGRLEIAFNPLALPDMIRALHLGARMSRPAHGSVRSAPPAPAPPLPIVMKPSARETLLTPSLGVLMLSFLLTFVVAGWFTLALVESWALVSAVLLTCVLLLAFVQWRGEQRRVRGTGAGA